MIILNPASLAQNGVEEGSDGIHFWMDDFCDNQLVFQVRKIPRVFVPVITPGTAER